MHYSEPIHSSHEPMALQAGRIHQLDIRTFNNFAIFLAVLNKYSSSEKISHSDMNPKAKVKPQTRPSPFLHDTTIELRLHRDSLV